MTASIIGLAVGLFQTSRPGTSALAICRHGVVLLPRSEKHKATVFPQHLDPLPCPIGQLVNTASTFGSMSVVLINGFRPSHPTKAFVRRIPADFWPCPVRGTSASGHSGFVLHTVTRLHRPELPHYYGITEASDRCHLVPACVLAFTLITGPLV